mmetsp:Transcript_7668/g.26732  ORF Transcript_7668/g.26732 Transcript_7668/m.26732 type:complete len:250 (-) Transcript_7668:222-971(-)
MLAPTPGPMDHQRAVRHSRSPRSTPTNSFASARVKSTAIPDAATPISITDAPSLWSLATVLAALSDEGRAAREIRSSLLTRAARYGSKIFSKRPSPSGCIVPTSWKIMASATFARSLERPLSLPKSRFGPKTESKMRVGISSLWYRGEYLGGRPRAANSCRTVGLTSRARARAPARVPVCAPSRTGRRRAARACRAVNSPCRGPCSRRWCRCPAVRCCLTSCPRSRAATRAAPRPTWPLFSVVDPPRSS